MQGTGPEEKADSAATQLSNSQTLKLSNFFNKVPFLLLSGISCAVTISAQGAAVGGLRLPTLVRIGNAVLSYGRYLLKAVWPTRLVVLYPFSLPLSIWQLALAGGPVAQDGEVFEDPHRARHRQRRQTRSRRGRPGTYGRLGPRGKGWRHHAGQGQVTLREMTTAERDGLPEGAIRTLGVETCDVWLNGRAYWSNVPLPVWQYTLGGYQVIKKWLSYREKELLGRSLSVDEVRYVTEVARRIAAILVLGPSLDANYQAVKQAPYVQAATDLVSLIHSRTT